VHIYIYVHYRKSTVFQRAKLISVVLRWPSKITVDFLWPERTAENNVIFDGQVLASENNKEVSAVKKKLSNIMLRSTVFLWFAVGNYENFGNPRPLPLSLFSHAQSLTRMPPLPPNLSPIPGRHRPRLSHSLSTPQFSVKAAAALRRVSYLAVTGRRHRPRRATTSLCCPRTAQAPLGGHRLPPLLGGRRLPPVPILENLARVKWADMRPALFGQARARPGTARNRPGLARSTSRAVLGPDRQPVRRARHDPIRLRPARHGSRPMWPVEHEHGQLGPIHHGR
jgi:hypothetical protein